MAKYELAGGAQEKYQMPIQENFSKTLLGGGAKSSEGYEVYFNDRLSIKYVENGLVVIIAAEGLAPKKTMAIYPEDMRIGSSNGEIFKGDIARKSILERVRKAGAFLGWTLL